MALVGNIIATAFAGNPSLINYDMFVAVFSMLSLIYLIATAFNEGFAGHPIIPVVLDLLNTLFFFCAAVAMAAELGTHSCSNQVSDDRSL
jgi:Membrane-associating domain